MRCQKSVFLLEKMFLRVKKKLRHSNELGCGGDICRLEMFCQRISTCEF